MPGVAREHLWGPLSSLSRCADFLKKTYSKIAIFPKFHIIVTKKLAAKSERGYRLFLWST